MATQNLTNSDLYINRELSLLEFNWRVLEQAKDDQMPLLERLNFLCISCANLDEFFEVRVAGLIQLTERGTSKVGPDGLDPKDLLSTISVRAHQLVEEQYRVLNEVFLPLLKKEGILFLKRSEWTSSNQQWLHTYFKEELLPILSPVGLDSAHPFPRILNKSLNFIIALTGKDAFGRNIDRAIVPAPRALPRIVKLPSDEGDKSTNAFVFLSSIIHAFIDELFYGMKVTGCYQFRVTRNSDLYVDEEDIDDLLGAMEGELAMRNYGDEIRLEIDEECPDETISFLLARFGMTREQLYPVNGPVNLNRLRQINDLVECQELKFRPFTSRVPALLDRDKDIFRAVKNQDFLFHHPFDSFAPVVELLRQAALDPNVLAIKQTLYRTGPDSPIVNALVKAARKGKEITVVIELRARFDEEANISLATRLQEAAVHVVYGVVGFKTHAKMILVLRREGKKLRNYIHLGTGNYHPKTARLYTDYGLLTCNKLLGEDVSRVFMQLTGLGKVSKLNKLLQSPFTLHKTLLQKIERETKTAKQGAPARIIMKVNSIVEPKLIRALYVASAAGVKIELIVRGVCCLRPGIKGVSESVEVRSIVGRFLEHTRIYYFENGGQPEVYGSSADLMDRNMFRRVETCFPIEDKNLSERVIKDLSYYLKDNSQAWILRSDGKYSRMTANGKEFKAQTALLEELND